MKKNFLVIGASSTIAKYCFQIWAERGDDLYLVARNEEKLKKIILELNLKSQKNIYTYQLDLDDINSHAIMLDAAEAAIGSIDTVLIAHGVLSDQKSCEQSVQKTLSQLKTNALSTISLLTQIANRFEAKQRGTIAVISSVAGDRGRASNYIYGCAKAMVNTFSSGLRQRLHKSNVTVITIKAGFVDTPMTASFKKGLLWAKPKFVAEKIVQAIDKKKIEVYVPSFWRLIMLVIKAIPNSLFKKLNNI